MMFSVKITCGSESIEVMVDGVEASWDVYEKAVSFCEMTDSKCDLVDAQTGEVIDWYDPEEEDEDYFPEDSDLEMGFNPYLGAYDFDC